MKNRLHSFITRKLNAQKKDGKRSVSQVDIAWRLNKRPEQINRWLAAPGNWTIETISDLLLAIAGEELQLEGEKAIQEPPVIRNYAGPAWTEELRVAGHDFKIPLNFSGSTDTIKKSNFTNSSKDLTRQYEPSNPQPKQAETSTPIMAVDLQKPPLQMVL